MTTNTEVVLRTGRNRITLNCRLQFGAVSWRNAKTVNKPSNCSPDEVTGAIEAEKLFKSGFRNVNLILFAVALPILRVPHRLSSHVNFNCNKWLVVATIAAVLSALSCQLDLSLSLSLSVSWCSSAGAVQFHSMEVG